VFSDLDAIEQAIGKPVTAMEAVELVTYVRLWIRAVYEVDLPATAYRERTIFTYLKRMYGSDAGRIVKWPFWKYNGKRNGDYITYSSFSKNMKWLTDIWYLELKEQLQIEAKKKSGSGAAVGFGKIQDL
jgi:hypothetical protein